MGLPNNNVSDTGLEINIIPLFDQKQISLKNISAIY